jgi:hypothetical protein
MLRSLKDLQNYKIHAKDGDLGSVHSFLFDDLSWSLKYLVVDTGKWLPGKKVLISPFDIDDLLWKDKIMNLRLKIDDIENSPSINDKQPVYLQMQEQKRKKLSSTTIIPAVGTPIPTYVTLNEDLQLNEITKHAEKNNINTHLRSSLEVMGYHMNATDGEIGYLDDIIIEDNLTWKIHYIIIYIGNWLTGKKVIVSPNWIDNIHWENKLIDIDLTKEKVEESPEYNPSEPVNREYETVLYDYYGKPKYWE